MLLTYAILVGLGAVILGVGLLFAVRVVRLLRPFGLSRPWQLLSILISVFFLGYVFISLRYLNIVMIPGLSVEAIITVIFFFGAVFVLILSILNYRLFGNIFGVGIDDPNAYRLFAEYVGMPPRKVMAMTRPEYSVACEVCGGDVKYSIPDLVRSHPQLERGVIVERVMGGTNYRFYIRHYCGNELREIPVRHDSEFEYRSHRPSRPVYG